MFDNFVEEQYRSSDPVFTHPLTSNRIFIGDIQSALDLDFLKEYKITTGLSFTIQSSPQRAIWTMYTTNQLSSTLFILFSMVKMKISPPSSILSLPSSKLTFLKAVYLSIAQLEFLVYIYIHLELYFSYLISYEISRNWFQRSNCTSS